MSTAALLENNKLVLRAYATLVDAAPNHADYSAHLQFIQEHGREHYINTLNQVFAGHSDEQLAASLLQSTGLNGVDLEGDGNIDNMALATQYIRANSGNRVKAILDLTEQLSNIQSGALRDIATAYNNKIATAHDDARFLWNTGSFNFNDNHQIQGGPGDDVFYADSNTGGTIYTINGQAINSKSIWIFNTKNQSENFDISESRKFHDPKPGLLTNAGSYGVKVQVSFQGLLSQAIAIDDRNDYQANQQDINQAVKQAVNGDAVLSKLLQAADGPNGTLFIASKINFPSYDHMPHFDFFDLKINFIEPDINALAPEVVQNFISQNPRSGVNDAASMLKYIKNQITSHDKDSQSLYHRFYQDARLARDDNGSPIKGEKSHTPKDHIIEGGVGNDIIVLGSATDIVTSVKSSNDTLKYSDVFGHDVIINFQSSGKDFDKFNFTQLHRTSPDVATKVNNQMKNSLPKNYTKFAIDGEIFITRKTVHSAEDVKQVFKDPGAGSAATQLYIAVDTNTNTGDVYQVIDGHAADDLTVNMLGSITLDYNAPWPSMAEHNFV